MSPLPLKCDLCHDSEGQPETLHLVSKCHTSAPLAARLEGGVLILSCYIPECSREVARFAVVKQEDRL
jgi:hypothetical protein